MPPDLLDDALELDAGRVRRRVSQHTPISPMGKVATADATKANKRKGTIMAKPDLLIIDGHAFSWQRLCDLRRQQMEAWKKSEGRQPALFELQTDCRPCADNRRPKLSCSRPAKCGRRTVIIDEDYQSFLQSLPLVREDA